MAEYETLIPHLFEGVYIVDKNRKIIFWNDASEKLTGYKAEEVINSFCFNNILRHVTADGHQLCLSGCPLHDTITTGNINNGNVFLHHKDGHRVPVNVRTLPIYDGDEIVAAVEVFTDSRQNEDAFIENRRLRKMLNTDELTNIFNRRYLDIYLNNKKTEVDAFETTFGVMFFDIDLFKKVNDTYGHNIGDEVLKMVSNTLKSAIRTDDAIGRWGGEEFIGIFNVDNLRALEKIANKLRILVEKSTLYIEEEDIKVTISVGGTLYRSGESIEDLVHRADQKMYQSKQTGRNKVTVE